MKWSNIVRVSGGNHLEYEGRCRIAYDFARESAYKHMKANNLSGYDLVKQSGEYDKESDITVWTFDFEFMYSCNVRGQSVCGASK
jgi:hypothetical protein